MSDVTPMHILKAESHKENGNTVVCTVEIYVVLVLNLIRRTATQYFTNNFFTWIFKNLIRRTATQCICVACVSLRLQESHKENGNSSAPSYTSSSSSNLIRRTATQEIHETQEIGVWQESHKENGNVSTSPLTSSTPNKLESHKENGNITKVVRMLDTQLLLESHKENGNLCSASLSVLDRFRNLIRRTATPPPVSFSTPQIQPNLIRRTATNSLLQQYH